MASSRTVQHVPKASSDELLRKFAESELGENPPEKKKIQRRKRRKISRTTRDRDDGESPVKNSSSSSLVEWKSLLPPSTRRSVLIRQLRVKGSEYRINGFFLAAMEKTWRRTIEGASKMFAEKHCNQHIRLISDVV